MILSETDFSAIASLGGKTVSIADGEEIPAIVSTMSDENEAIAGGIIGKTALKVRVLDTHLNPSSKLVGAKIRYDGTEYRILSTKKHPLSAARELTICER